MKHSSFKRFSVSILGVRSTSKSAHGMNTDQGSRDMACRFSVTWCQNLRAHTKEVSLAHRAVGLGYTSTFPPVLELGITGIYQSL